MISMKDVCMFKNTSISSRENLYSSLKYAGQIWKNIIELEFSIKARGPSLCPNELQKIQLEIDIIYLQYRQYWDEIIPTQVSTITNWDDDIDCRCDSCVWSTESSKFPSFCHILLGFTLLTCKKLILVLLSFF